MRWTSSHPTPLPRLPALGRFGLQVLGDEAAVDVVLGLQRPQPQRVGVRRVGARGEGWQQARAMARAAALARTRACRAADAREAVSSDADADGCVCDESPDAEAPAVRKRVLALRGAMVLACAALSLAALQGGYADAAGGEEIDGDRVA